MRRKQSSGELSLSDGKCFFFFFYAERERVSYSSTHQLVLILRKYTDRSRRAILVHDKIYWQHTKMDTCGEGTENILYAEKQSVAFRK